MTETAFRGPVANMGALENNTVEPEDGPSVSYQGLAFPDPRDGPYDKDGVAPGRVKGYMASPFVYLTDGLPSIGGSTVLAAAQVITSGTAMSLMTACVGGTAAGVASICPGIPIVPVGTTVATTAIALDFGFTTGTTVASSTAVTVVDNGIFDIGQWLVVGGAGNVNSNGALIAQVASIPTVNITTIYLSQAAATAINNAPIGQGNLFNQNTPAGTQFVAAAAATAAIVRINAGVISVLDPRAAITRTVQVSNIGTTASLGTATVLISGYDVFLRPLTELIKANGSAAGQGYGKKAFKYITSAVAQTTVATSYSLGVSPIFGINFRSDALEHISAFVGGIAVTNTAAWTAAIITTATNTTGDVRGTINGSTVLAANTNATTRVTIGMHIPPQKMLNADPVSYTSLFGVTQA